MALETWQLNAIENRCTRLRWNGYSEEHRTAYMLVNNTHDVVQALCDLSQVQRITLSMDHNEREMVASVINSVGEDHPMVGHMLQSWDEKTVSVHALRELERKLEHAKEACFTATKENSGCEAGKREFLENTGLFDEDEIDRLFTNRYRVTLTYLVDAQDGGEAIEMVRNGDAEEYGSDYDQVDDDY